MKFYLSEPDKAELIKSRQKLMTEGLDRELYFHIGYFNMWYADAEIWLTMILAKATKSTHNLNSFDLLTKGLDARTKVERLRLASETFKPIGPNLTARFLIYEKDMIGLRNKLAHTYPVAERDMSRITFTRLSNVPAPGQTPSKEKDSMPMLELFEHGVWMNLFNDDLKAASRALAHSQMIEIDQPLSPLRPGSNPPPREPKPAAIPNRRARKRLRKGQAPRGTRPAE